VPIARTCPHKIYEHRPVGKDWEEVVLVLRRIS
jgi:hypothetical protein